MYQVYVRIELVESDSGKKLNWDDDTFYVEGDRSKADALFDAIANGAGKANADFVDGASPSSRKAEETP